MTLLTTIWTTFIIQSSWLKSSITCLYKNKVSRSEAENYRGLSIIAACSQIPSAMIISRIRNAYDRLIMNCQFSFRVNRSTTDAMFYFYLTKCNTSILFLCFIDLRAAYDWINRDMLCKILEIRLQSATLVKLLKAFYTGTSAAIKGTKVVVF